MIGYLRGTLAEKSPIHVVVECCGIGYDLDVPMSTFYHLPNVGQVVLLRTHLAIRDDAHLLFGFLTEDERVFFRQLLKTNGVGSRLALAVLSAMTLDQFSIAVLSKDLSLLKTIPGVGSRLAERLTLEMKDFCCSRRSSFDQVNSSTLARSVVDDISHALVSLGYSMKEIAVVMPKVSGEVDVSDGIKLALKYLSAQ